MRTGQPRGSQGWLAPLQALSGSLSAVAPALESSSGAPAAAMMRPNMTPSSISRPLIAAALLAGAVFAHGAPAVPSGWTNERLSGATYLILAPQIQGNQNLISAEQRVGVLRALRKDSGDAILRRYPKGRVVQEGAFPGAIRVTPVLTAPAALVPWAKLSVSLVFDLPGGGRRIMNEPFGLTTLVRQGPQAANYAFDQIARRLP